MSRRLGGIIGCIDKTLIVSQILFSRESGGGGCLCVCLFVFGREMEHLVPLFKVFSFFLFRFRCSVFGVLSGIR